MEGYKFVKISEEEAKENYCKSNAVYVSTNERKFWKMPYAYEYSSHAPKEDLFYRSIPEYEGEAKFFIKEKRKWICYYINSRGNEVQKIFYNMEDGLSFTKILDQRIERKTCGGYSFMEV